MHNGNVIQTIGEYDNLEDAIRKLRSFNQKHGAMARAEWGDVFVVIAARVWSKKLLGIVVDAIHDAMQHHR